MGGAIWFVQLVECTLVCGNVVRFPSKCLGFVFFTQAMHQFSDFISEHNLIDLKGGVSLGQIVVRLFQG